MSAPVHLWIIRALWLSLPFTLLDSVLRATNGAGDATRITAQILFWVFWAVGLVVSLSPLPSTLTALRVIVPVAPLGSVVAVAIEPGSASGWIGLAVAALAAIVAMTAAVGDWYVDGASYGDERRFCLRAPTTLLLGPIPLVWLLTVVPLPAGIILLAEGTYLAAVPLVLVGIATAWWGPFTLWRLARRWLVFVPAGATLVDAMAIAEPVLLARRQIARIGPAHVGSEATDLTVGAPGLVVQIDLMSPVELAPTPPRGEPTEVVEVDALLVVPSRPGTLLAYADERSFAVARD
ncbi:MAG: hypothetical protein ACK5O2_06645 [Microthrixaceae bacterium]